MRVFLTLLMTIGMTLSVFGGTRWQDFPETNRFNLTDLFMIGVTNIANPTNMTVQGSNMIVTLSSKWQVLSNASGTDISITPSHTPTLNIPNATNNANGVLRSNDFQTFANKQPPSGILTNIAVTGAITNPLASYYIQVQSCLLPTNNPAQLDTGSNYVWRLLFDDSTDETAYWDFSLPEDYATNGSLVVIYSMLTGAANKTNVFQVATHLISMTASNMINVDNWSSAISVTNVIPTTQGWATNFTVNLGLSASPGDMVRLKLNRDADNTTDSAVGDTALHRLRFQYQRK